MTSFAIALLLAVAAPPLLADDDWAAIVAASKRVAAIVRNDAGLNESAQVAALVALGDSTIPALFALHLGMPLPSAAEGGDPSVAADEAPTALALAALRALPSEAVDDFLVTVAAGATDPRRAIDVVRVAGELARKSSFGVLLRVTAAMDELLQGHPVVNGTLRTALQSIVAHACPPPAELRTLVASLPPAFTETALDAVGTKLADERATLCCDLFGKRQELDRTVLVELDRRPPTNTADADRVARLLCSNTNVEAVETRRLVAHALRRYPALESAEALIDLLADVDPRVRAVALQSLGEVAGVTLPADATSWRDWRNVERRWRAEELPEIKRRLESADVQEALRWVATLSLKRVHAAEVAAVVGPFLEHERAELRRAACEALGRLATPACTEWLRRALVDRDAAVRAIAQRSLAKMGERS